MPADGDRADLHERSDLADDPDQPQEAVAVVSPDPAELAALAAAAREELALAAKRELALDLRRSQRRRRVLTTVLAVFAALVVVVAALGAVLGARAVKSSPGYVLRSYLEAWQDGDEAAMRSVLCDAQQVSSAEVGALTGVLDRFDILRTRTITKGRHARVLVELSEGSREPYQATFDMVRRGGRWAVCTAPGLPPVDLFAPATP